LLNSARLGTNDYEFVKIIETENYRADVFEVKSKIDGKIYAAKRLHYHIGSKDQDRTIVEEAIREISCLRTLNHPMIMAMLDIFKDSNDFPCIIMEKCN
jgi:serine/threonine protein kinase